jgi:hypothetical protein
MPTPGRVSSWVWVALLRSTGAAGAAAAAGAPPARRTRTSTETKDSTTALFNFKDISNLSLSLVWNVSRNDQEPEVSA